MEMLEAIKWAGVVGAGGAGFPSHIKLNAKAEWFLVNAAECEPMIETDKFICRTYPERIIRTMVRITEHLEATHAVLALKDKYQKEINALQAAIDQMSAPVILFTMRSFYPAGDEQTLVQQVTGRCVPERGLPLDVGCVVHNVGTVLSIADALEEIPVMDKYLSVTGAVKKPVMFHVPIGTSIREVIAAAGVTTEPYRVILGGPMMGKTLQSEEEIDTAVITKTTGNLLVLPPEHSLFGRASLSVERMKRQAQTACIQCRMCTDLCPRYLIGHEVQPHIIMRNLWRESVISDDKEYERCFKSAANCCSCGACELFACPMGLAPRKMNDYVKGQMIKKGIQVEKNLTPEARMAVEYHKIPTERLIARLGLSPYVKHEEPVLYELKPESCCIPLSQHIGKPAIPAVQPGSEVRRGTLIAQGAEGLSANIYSGMAGIVTEVTGNIIKVCGKGD